MKLPMIPGDKANHFIWGLVASAILLWLTNLEFTIYFTVSVALFKEILDRNRTKTTFNWADFGWTLLGIASAILIKNIE